MLGMVESARDTMMEEKKWCEMGCGRRKQWTSRNTAWEALLAMEKYNYIMKEMDQGAVTLVVDLAKAFERVQLKLCGFGRCM